MKTDNKTQNIISQSPEIKKLFQELNDTAGTDVSLSKYRELLAEAKKLSEKYNDRTIPEKAIAIIGKNLIEKGSYQREGRSKHINNLETALKLLFDYYGKRKTETSGGLNPAVLLLIARACYERSVLILSRQDKVMVEKKKRIIKKGIEFAKEAVNKENNNKDALRLKSILLLELEKIDKDDREVSDLKDALTNAIQKGCTEFSKHVDDIEIALKYVEIVEVDKSLLEGIVNSTLSEDVAKDIELKKAKAHFLLGNDRDVITCMETFTKQLVSLELPFFDPVWSDAAEVVKHLKDKDYWRGISLQLWEAT